MPQENDMSLVEICDHCQRNGCEFKSGESSNCTCECVQQNPGTSSSTCLSEYNQDVNNTATAATNALARSPKCETDCAERDHLCKPLLSVNIIDHCITSNHLSPDSDSSDPNKNELLDSQREKSPSLLSIGMEATPLVQAIMVRADPKNKPIYWALAVDPGDLYTQLFSIPSSSNYGSAFIEKAAQFGFTSATHPVTRVNSMGVIVSPLRADLMKTEEVHCTLWYFGNRTPLPSPKQRHRKLCVSEHEPYVAVHGKTVVMAITHIVFTNDLIAAAVAFPESSVSDAHSREGTGSSIFCPSLCRNLHPHITIALKPGVPAVKSNAVLSSAFERSSENLEKAPADDESTELWSLSNHVAFGSREDMTTGFPMVTGQVLLHGAQGPIRAV